MIVSIIQLNSQPNLEQNLENIYRHVKEASVEGADLVALPENFAFMGDERQRLLQTEEISQAAEKSLAAWAGESGIYILGGGYPVAAKNGKVYNRAVLINPKGKTVAVYNKIHLFDVVLSEKETYRESDMVEAGKDMVVADLPEYRMKAGLSVCYDVRFPELYREMAKQGAHLLFVPAAFTRPTGSAHWETLLRSRAIENSAFVVAPAQVGKHGAQRETYGHSMIVDPWGRILSNLRDKPGMAMTRLKLEDLKDVRRKLPALEHRIL